MLVLSVLVLLANPLRANYKFYNTIKQVCKVYQIQVDYKDMSLETDSGNDLFLNLHLDAGRNNFDTVLMVGFLAAGKAMDANQDIHISGVRVYLIMSSMYGSTVIASASAEDIIKLEKGDISAAEFKNKHIVLM